MEGQDFINSARGKATGRTWNKIAAINRQIEPLLVKQNRILKQFITNFPQDFVEKSVSIIGIPKDREAKMLQMPEPFERYYYWTKDKTFYKALGTKTLHGVQEVIPEDLPSPLSGDIMFPTKILTSLHSHRTSKK